MLTLIQYNESNCLVKERITADDAAQLVDKEMINWLDVETTDQGIEEDTARLFDIHPLMLEDIMQTDLLPKFELFDKYLFFTAKMLNYLPEKDLIQEEHLSIVLNKNLLITFQEGLPGDAFDELRSRIQLNKGIIRKSKGDYLFHHIIDAVVDQYMDIMNMLRNKIELLEEKSFADPSFDVMESVIDIKKDVNILRKYTLPMRDAINKVRVEGKEFIDKTSINYFQDVVDHLNYLVSSFDTSREMLRDLMDLQQSNQDNERNRVMKTLTVVSAIFIPLTFLAGLYGMNFQYMPELHQKWGYPVLLLVMVLVAVGMSIYMRMKKWF
ncbi:MAG: magnesium/cobalt transporter CorA [Bacteroidota bacterium]